MADERQQHVIGTHCARRGDKHTETEWASRLTTAGRGVNKENVIFYHFKYLS